MERGPSLIRRLRIIESVWSMYCTLPTNSDSSSFKLHRHPLWCVTNFDHLFTGERATAKHWSSRYSNAYFFSNPVPIPQYSRTTAEIVETVLYLRHEGAKSTLRGLHLVLKHQNLLLQPNYTSNRIYNASFLDFLFDPSRVGKYFINPNSNFDAEIHLNIIVLVFFY